jgi:hypothetical protein
MAKTPANLETKSTWVNRVVLEVASTLPPEVSAFVLARCVFVAIGRDAAGLAVLPGQIGRNQWLIIIDDRLALEDVHGVVAHEVAHAWLRHSGLGLERHEREASRLAATWGFSGFGTNEEQNAAVAREAHATGPTAAAGPRTQVHIDEGKLRIVCRYCKQDAELYAPAFYLPGGELVARCPPERCDWLFAFRPKLDCPSCSTPMQLEWERSFLRLLSNGGWRGIAAWAHRAASGRLHGASLRAPSLRARCGRCRTVIHTRVKLAERSTMIAPRAEATA